MVHETFFKTLTFNISLMSGLHYCRSPITVWRSVNFASEYINQTSLNMMRLMKKPQM